MDGTTPDQMTATKLAQRLLAKHDNDIQAAQAEMVKVVSKTPPLFRQLMTPLVSVACYDALRSVVRGERRTIWTAENYTKGGNGDRLQTLGLTLLDFPLPTTMRAIKFATKAELIEAALFYSTQAKDMNHKAAWLEAIAAKVGNKTVGDKFTAEKLQALQEASK